MVATLFAIVGLVVCLSLVFRKQLFKLRQKWFAAFMSNLAAQITTTLEAPKLKLFSSMSQISSRDAELKNKKQIRILEIGAGSGTNLRFYPDGSQLVLVDINAQFENKLRENLLKFPALTLERLLHTDAADMRDVESESVDVVVSTTVLCSVTDISRVLSEVWRVLVPGGKFYFIEHVIDEPGTLRSRIQTFLTSSRIWPTIFCGCHLSRDIGKSVNQAGFQSVQFENFYMTDSSHFVFYFVKTQIVGLAVK